MDRFKLKCTISARLVELQFDIKKMPGEKGPSYMVSIDGMFSGYITKDSSGKFKQVMNSNFTEEDLLMINQQLSSNN